MLKLIPINGKNFIVKKHQGNYYYRINDLLIIKPTIREMKQDILIELTK